MAEKIQQDSNLGNTLDRILVSHQTAKDVLTVQGRERDMELHRERDRTTKLEMANEQRAESVKHSLAVMSERVSTTLETQRANINNQINNAVIFRKTTADFIAKLAHLQSPKDQKL